MFITVEGLDGSGKSTQIRMLSDALAADGVPLVVTREPGGTALGDRLRELILDPASPPATPLVVALMLSASRSQLIHDVIRPALDDGKTVILDRYADSTIAYQSFGSGLPLETVRELTAIATGGLQPDVTVYIDVPAEEGVRRLEGRGEPDRLDAEALDFHRRVRAGYEYLMQHDSRRWIRINGSRTPREVHAAILGEVRQRMPGFGGTA